MTIRQLTPDEIPALDGHECFEGGPAPRAAVYFAAFDGERLAGLWCIVPEIHTEPVWIDPAYRGRTVGGRLWKAVRQFLDNVGLRTVSCYAATASVASYLTRLGFRPQPFLPFTLCLPPSPPPESP